MNFTPGGKSIELNVNASDTVANLQQLIHDSEGISPKHQRLYFDCQVLGRLFQLRHNGKLDSYIITDGSDVQCVIHNDKKRNKTFTQAFIAGEPAPELLEDFEDIDWFSWTT